MLILSERETRWTVVSCIAIAMFGLTLMAKWPLPVHPAVTWVTIEAPNPPAPLPYHEGVAAENAGPAEEGKIGI